MRKLFWFKIWSIFKSIFGKYFKNWEDHLRNRNIRIFSLFWCCAVVHVITLEPSFDNLFSLFPGLKSRKVQKMKSVTIAYCDNVNHDMLILVNRYVKYILANNIHHSLNIISCQRNKFNNLWGNLVTPDQLVNTDGWMSIFMFNLSFIVLFVSIWIIYLLILRELKVIEQNMQIDI